MAVAKCRMQNRLIWLSTVLVVMSASGASCNRQWLRPFGPTGPTAPQVLSAGAQVAQIAAAVNQNSGRVQSLTAPNATISVSDHAAVPSLRGVLALERPHRFRLTAGTGLLGQELDLGSNDELFWLWVRRGQPPGVYYCRHDQFAGSAAYQVMPIEPQWLQSALGLVQIDPASVYDGPVPHGDGAVELKTYLPSAVGRLHRVLVIDSTGAVKEQHVYDAAGTTLIASAVAQSHRYYPVEQVSLPQRVAVRLPTAQIAFTIDLGQVQINQVAGGPQLWSMPPFEGYQQYDLGTAPASMHLPSTRSATGGVQQHPTGAQASGIRSQPLFRGQFARRYAFPRSRRQTLRDWLFGRSDQQP